MSRKMRVPKQQIDALAVPAWTFWLLGRDPGYRLHGWVQQAQAGMYGEPTAEQVCERHQDALIEEATSHAFEPFWIHKRRRRATDSSAGAWCSWPSIGTDVDDEVSVLLAEFGGGSPTSPFVYRSLV
jgi:hypothetical protein